MGQRIDPDCQIFDFFAPGGQPVVVERGRAIAFVWEDGCWKPSQGLVEMLYLQGKPLDHDSFVGLFPNADLRLLKRRPRLILKAQIRNP
tara:strand:+ start:330 stop:596 length:267 start_codon:yes stop_codon:yes gene_type:complete